MSLRNSATAWGTGARSLHWLMAGLFCVEWMAGEFDDAFGGRGFHVSLGLLFLGLLVIRALWRLANPVPALPASSPAWERRAATWVHVGWYAVMAALPLTGLAYQQFKARTVSFFGWGELPQWLPTNNSLAEIAEELHEGLASFALILLALHVAAALKHHFISGDDVLTRMWRGARD